MALSFPVNPSNGQIYVADNGITYVYTNGKWTGQVAGNISGFTDRLVANVYNAVLNTTSGNLTLPGNLILGGGEISYRDGNLLVNGNVVQGAGGGGAAGDKLSNSSAAFTLRSDGIAQFNSNVSGITANDYNSPYLLQATNGDNNWAVGFTYDGGAEFFTQATFYGIGDDQRGFKIKDNGSGREWKFGGSGALSVPGVVVTSQNTLGPFLDLQQYDAQLVANANVTIRSSYYNNVYDWNFDEFGRITFPDGTVYTGSNIGNLWIDSTTYTDLWLRTVNNNNIYISPDDINALFVPKVSENLTTTLTGYSANGLGVFTANTFISLDDASNTNTGNIKLLTSHNNQNYSWTFNLDGTMSFPNNAIDNGTGAIELKSRSWSQLTYNNADMNQQPSKNHSTTFYVEGGDATLEIFRWDSGNVLQHRQWTFLNDGSLALPDTGTIIFPDSTIQSTAFTNDAVSTYLSSHADQTFGGNVTIQGNLTVNGNVSYINTQSLVIDDNIVNYANANPGDSLDLGFVAHRTVSSILQHTGLVRDASANNWKLFSNVVPAPGNTVDFTNAIYDDLVAGNITSPTITALQANAATQSDLIIALNSNISLANTTMRLYVDGQIAAANTRSSGGTNYSNVNVAAYLNATGYNLYSNVNVAVYLSGSVGDIIPVSAYSNNLGNAAKPWGNFVTYNLELAGGYLKTGGTGGISGQVLKSTGNANPPAWSNIADVISGSGAQITVANLKLAASGNIVFADGTVQTTAAAGGGSNYGNGNVASYLITNAYINSNSAYGNGNVTSYLPTHSGNVGVNSLIGTTPNVTLVANSYSTTFDTYGNVAFGNAAYPVQIYVTSGITTTTNVTVGGIGVTMPNRPAFRVNGTGVIKQTTANVNLKGTAVSTIFNQGSYFDATTGKFTAPVAGIYQVSITARVADNNGLNQIAVFKNGLNSSGNVVAFWETDTNTGVATHFSGAGTVQLAVGDYLSANIVTGNITFDGNDNWCVTYLG